MHLNTLTSRIPTTYKKTEKMRALVLLTFLLTTCFAIPPSGRSSSLPTADVPFVLPPRIDLNALQAERASVAASPATHPDELWQEVEEAIYKRGTARAVTLISEGRVDVNRVDGYGRSLLYHALVVGNHSIATALLRNGCDPNLGDDRGRPRLYHAIVSEQLEFIELLLKYGAKVKDNGFSVVDTTKRTKNSRLIRILDKAGAFK